MKPELEGDGYSNAYAIQHPVKSRYDRLLTALGDAAKSRMIIKGGILTPGEEGREQIRFEREALMDVAILQVEIACYFREKDFTSVFPQFSKDSIFSEIGRYDFSLDQLERRRALIKDICEKEHWFEDEGHRLTADEIPEE